jgi:hypothetical protein
MAGRRANGDGTRARQRKDGRREVKISVPLPEGGTQRVTVYGKTSADAVNAARAELNLHASVAFTLDTYGHLLPTLGKDAALALDRFLATG